MSLYIGNKPIKGVYIRFVDRPGWSNTSDATISSGSQMLKDITAYGGETKYVGEIETKNESDITVDAYTVHIPSGYYDSNYDKSVVQSEIAIPSISVDSTGLITSTVNQDEGYVIAGSNTTTLQLDTKSAETFIPSDVTQVIPSGVFLTGNQTISSVPVEEITVTAQTSDLVVSPTSGKYINKITIHPVPSQSKTVNPGYNEVTATPDSGYLLSNVTVTGDTNLIPENIAEGVSIFGVLGTHIGGVTGIDFGEVTISSEQETVTINHNLGVIPSWVALIPKNLTLKNGTTTLNINGTVIKAAFSSSASDITNTVTSTSITFKAYSSSYGFAATGYYWIAIS